MSSDNKREQVTRVLLVTLFLNVLIALVKLGYGYAFHTLSMFADGLHSLMDGSSNIIGLVAIYFAFAPPDNEHHYGHRKAEVLASMAIAIILALTSFELLRELLQRYFNPQNPVFSYAGYFIILFGLMINIGVVTYESRAAKRLKSHILSSDAEHTRSDILVTLSVLISLVAIQFQLFWLDYLVSAVIVWVIGRMAYGLFQSNLNILMDYAPIDRKEVLAILSLFPEIQNPHKIRAHGTPDAIYLECHIWVEPDLNISEAHQIAHQAKAALLEKIEGLIDATIHVEPAKNEKGVV